MKVGEQEGLRQEVVGEYLGNVRSLEMCLQKGQELQKAFYFTLSPLPFGNHQFANLPVWILFVLFIHLL